MKITYAPRNVLQINDAKIIFRNLRGEGGKFNKEGDRNFAVIIEDGILDTGAEIMHLSAEEMANALIRDENRYGAGWNVKIKAPREEGDMPFIYLPIKVKFNDRGPKVFLESLGNKVKLDESTIASIDEIDISSVDLDVRPYDDVINGKPFRAAYVQSMWVVQDIDRFEARFAEEEYPTE